MMRELRWMVLLAMGVGVGVAAQAESSAVERARLGLVALQRWYAPAGVYATTGWWNSANALTVVADYDVAMGTKEHAGVLANSLEQAPQQVAGFLNNFYDDEGWWALAWVAAYDETGERRYLDAAEGIFADMSGGWDQTCGGGIWWSKDRTYKNAIANELFFSVAAHLAMRAPTAHGQYADWAAKEWRWFRGSGMINDRHLVNDGLTIDKTSGSCRNNGRTVWTYNQGVLLGALAEWSKSAGNSAVLDEGRSIADAALRSLTDKDGILHDTCEPECGPDGVQFKGIFMRNLHEFDTVAHDPRYRTVFAKNADSIWTKDQAPGNQFGVVWSGPPVSADAGTQSSAVDALVAAVENK